MNDELQNNTAPARLDFESLVTCYYEALYRFALSLTHSEADASDLTQHTFYIWATKGSQLKDVSKVKSWLFTTLHRAFLETRRRQTRFPHLELSEVEAELPQLSPASVSQSDTNQLLHALKKLDAGFQAAVALFYLEDYPYKEIARILDVPLGTVKSRIARGLAQLHQLLAINVPGDRAELAKCQ
jgi:RNA polymerase sigma-70 factor (ECF subfamily)